MLKCRWYETSVAGIHLLVRCCCPDRMKAYRIQHASASIDEKERDVMGSGLVLAENWKGRNLPVKEFCYLRTVHLTAAV